MPSPLSLLLSLALALAPLCHSRRAAPRPRRSVIHSCPLRFHCISLFSASGVFIAGARASVRNVGRPTTESRCNIRLLPCAGPGEQPRSNPRTFVSALGRARGYNRPSRNLPVIAGVRAPTVISFIPRTYAPRRIKRVCIQVRPFKRLSPTDSFEFYLLERATLRNCEANDRKQPR